MKEIKEHSKGAGDTPGINKKNDDFIIKKSEQDFQRLGWCDSEWQSRTSLLPRSLSGVRHGRPPDPHSATRDILSSRSVGTCRWVPLFISFEPLYCQRWISVIVCYSVFRKASWVACSPLWTLLLEWSLAAGWVIMSRHYSGTGSTDSAFSSSLSISAAGWLFGRWWSVLALPWLPNRTGTKIDNEWKESASPVRSSGSIACPSSV